MATEEEEEEEEERCAEAKKFQRIDDALHQGDLEALRAAGGPTSTTSFVCCLSFGTDPNQRGITAPPAAAAGP